MWSAVSVEDNDNLKVSDGSVPEWEELLETLKLSAKGLAEPWKETSLEFAR